METKKTNREKKHPHTFYESHILELDFDDH